MQVHIQRTEQGLVIPIPEDLVQQSKFSQDSLVNITLENGRFVIADPDEPLFNIRPLA